MRLIDADEFKENILSGLYIFCQENKEDITNAIDSEPTVIPFASVQYETFREYERPIGKWLNDRVAFHFTCDYCGCNIRQSKDIVFEGNYDYNFCPNCGADMRGDNNGKEETT